MAIATSTAVMAASAVGAGASIMGQRNARKSAKETNRANQQMAAEANAAEMLRYYQSRGAAMGATLEELMARPGDPLYKEGVSMFNPDGSAKESAVLPMYMSDLESSMGDNISEKYDVLQEAYNPEQELARIQQYRQDLMPAVAGQVQTVQDLYSGQELANRQADLDEVNRARTEGILMAAQMNARAQDFTGRSGIVGNSGNAITNQLQALARGYQSAGEKTAAANMALKENDLAQRKNPNTVAGALTGAANASVAGLNTMFAPEKATSTALNQGGFQLGQGRMPEYNVGAQAPIPGYNAGSAIMGGLNAGLGAYTLAQAYKPKPAYSSPAAMMADSMPAPARWNTGPATGYDYGAPILDTKTYA